MKSMFKKRKKKTKSRLKFRTNVVISFWVVIIFLVFGFVEIRHNGKVCTDIKITIENEADNYFLTPEDVIRLMTDNGKEKVLNNNFSNISIKTLEKRVKEGNAFVEKCQIARNLKGILFVDVVLKRPIARFMRHKNPDVYVDSEGTILNVLKKFTARVLLVTQGDRTSAPDFKRNQQDKTLLEMVKYIYNDPFLKAQIAQVDVLKNNDLILYLQLGKQIVDFGDITQWKSKLERFKIFYKEILPRKGWNAYRKISLRFDKQIICE